jgi:hypothetical protein
MDKNERIDMIMVAASLLIGGATIIYILWSSIQ